VAGVLLRLPVLHDTKLFSGDFTARGPLLTEAQQPHIGLNAMRYGMATQQKDQCHCRKAHLGKAVNELLEVVLALERTAEHRLVLQATARDDVSKHAHVKTGVDYMNDVASATGGLFCNARTAV